MDEKLKEKQGMRIQKEGSITLSSSTEEVKLAAIAISSNVRLRSSDMPAHMQEHAMRCTRSLLDSVVSPETTTKTRPNPTHIARALKKEFDSSYGPAWQCVVGGSFGSFVTHSPGGFVYFSIDSLSVLLFKTEVHLVTQSQPN
ncbi:Dynein light chain [Trema orientale]|uniref:Dynein light chain n=1 Tax=Trema orientale TaxID=63057 RepID=A0A2P5E8J7_TREOI|nr:Dynein light chain [Trema orientale]